MTLTWESIKRSFQNGKLLTTVTWRQMVLSGTRNEVTGWFTKTWSDTTNQEVILAEGTAAASLYPLGGYVVGEAVLVTDNAIDEGDRILFSTRVYEVQTVKAFIWDNALKLYMAGLERLPLEE